LSIRPLKQALAVFAAGAFFWLVFSLFAGSGAHIHTLQDGTMGTTWSVQVSSADVELLPRHGAELKALLAHLDRAVFSTWNPDSELSRLNRSPLGVAQPVSAELLAVLQLAQEIHGKSRNSFDVSVGPLVNLWGFGPEPFAGIPDAASIATARARLGLDALQLDPGAGTVTRHKDLQLDLSGIAKGYAVDRVAELLLAQGYASFLVEIGGEIRLQGLRPDGSPWIVAVERPQSGMREVYARVSSRGAALALAGSGDYRNFRDVGGRRYSHEIDPRTGYPVAHQLAAVTVISSSAAHADAWATALMVLGPEEGMVVADSEELAAYFIMHAPDGLTHKQTAAFERFLQDE
jgi:thiamine biosynthesis lipoprotein